MGALNQRKIIPSTPKNVHVLLKRKNGFGKQIRLEQDACGLVSTT